MASTTDGHVVWMWVDSVGLLDFRSSRSLLGLMSSLLLGLFHHARVIHRVRSRLYITTLRNSFATQSQSRSVPSSVKPSFAASRRDDRFSGSIRASLPCPFRFVNQCEITGGAASGTRPCRQHDGTTIHPSASRRCCSLCA